MLMHVINHARKNAEAKKPKLKFGRRKKDTRKKPMRIKDINIETGESKNL